jgi:hypothetical protein
MEILLLAIPLVLVGKWSLALAKARNSSWYGVTLFAACAIILGLIYAQGYESTRELMTDQMWTAASMTIAVLLAKSVPVLLACWLAHWYLWPTDQSQ